MIVVGLFFYLSTTNTTDSLDKKASEMDTFSAAVRPINAYMEQCLKDTALQGVLYISQRGGYYTLTGIETLSYPPVPYYFSHNQTLMPTKQRVEQELSAYINDNLFICVQNLAIFKEQGFDVSLGTPLAQATIADDAIAVNLMYAVTASKGGSSDTLSSFSTIVKDVRLGQMLDVAGILTSEQMSDQEHLCFSCVFQEATKNDFVITLSTVGNDTVLFTINDTRNSHLFNFAFRYALSRCTDTECLIAEFGSLDIQPIPEQEAFVGQEFTYQVNASGIGLTFLDFTPSFDIDEHAGNITFIPQAQDVGLHTFWIKVTDVAMHEAFTSFTMVVKK